jgi:MFS family permease
MGDAAVTANYGWCGEPEVPTKRSELRTRWTVLALLCITLFGNYYVYDNPTAVEQQLADKYGGVRGNATVAVDDDGSNSDASSFSFKYNLLYSLYSWPNVVLPFLGGWLSDKLGVRLMTVVFICLCSLGQLIFAIGCSLDAGNKAAWPIMWMGRIVFGFGGESLSVAQSAMLAQWFAGKELAFALGINLALARVGSVVNDAVSVQIATQSPVENALWVGFGVCLLSTLTGLASFYVDRTAEDKLRANLGYKTLKRRGFCSWLGSLGGAFKASGDEDEQTHSLTGAAAYGDDAVAPAIDEPPKEEILLSSVFTFPAVFWVLTLSVRTLSPNACAHYTPHTEQVRAREEVEDIAMTKQTYQQSFTDLPFSYPHAARRGWLT